MERIRRAEWAWESCQGSGPRLRARPSLSISSEVSCSLEQCRLHWRSIKGQLLVVSFMAEGTYRFVAATCSKVVCQSESVKL